MTAGKIAIVESMLYQIPSKSATQSWVLRRFGRRFREDQLLKIIRAEYLAERS